MGQYECHVFVCTSGETCPQQGDVEKMRQDPAHRRGRRRQAQGSPRQQGGLLLAVRARADDRGLPGECLVSRASPSRISPRSSESHILGGRPVSAPALRARRAGRQQGDAPAQRSLMRWNQSPHPHAAGRSRRRRGGEPSPHGAGRIDPPARRRHLRVSPARPSACSTR